MTIKKIKEIINKSKKGNKEFSLSDIADVQSKCKVTLEMDRLKQTYFYQIKAEDLENSSLAEEDIKTMVEEGWRFLEDKNIFFKNM
jgi:hypothetical protein